MYFDAAAASTLALFVSSRTGNPSCRPTHHPIVPNLRPPTHSRLSTLLYNNNNPNNLLVPYTVKPEKYASLLEWLRSNGAFVNDSLTVAKSTQGEMAGYGAFVQDAVQEGDLLFSIPRDLCVTIEKAMTSTDDDGTFGEGLSTIVEKAGPGGSTVAMAGYMAKEYILLYLEKRDERQGMERNGNSNAQTNSRWGPYMELLPWKRGINNQEHVLFWNDRKIEELLQGSMCYSEARSLREEVALSITVLGPLLKRSVRMARGDLSTDPLQRLTSLLPWQQYQKNDDDLDEILDDKLIGDAIKGAFVTLLTRSFADDVDDEDTVAVAASSSDDETDSSASSDGYSEKLVPLLDLLQHSDEPNVRHKVVGDAVEVRARVDIDAGSEIWNQYRSEEEESMPYSRFFTRFGFVPGIDEPIENLLLDKSTIFYPQKAEV